LRAKGRRRRRRRRRRKRRGVGDDDRRVVLTIFLHVIPSYNHNHGYI
jgi:hypothetical protein